MAGDRIFGLAALFVALVYIASATQIQTSFLTDPVGPRAFPYLIGSVAALSALFLILRPDPDPEPQGKSGYGALVITVVVLVAYTYALKPSGFLMPTAIAAGILSYQISSNLRTALYAGAGLSIGLFVLFKFVLGLGLVAFPRGMIG